MPWRLILFILIFALFLTFITFNLENKCDISFGFVRISDIPVFVTIFVSFVLGLISAIPLVLHIKKKSKVKKDISPAETSGTDHYKAEDESKEKIRQDAAAARKRFFSGRSGGKNG